MAREATDGLYIELDYYTPENYLTYTAEGSMISGVYIDSDYIEPDFFVQNPGTTTFSITCDLTELIGETKEFEAAFSIAASLSNAAVKTVDVDSSLNTSATQSVTSTRIRQGACNFGALFTPSINAVAKINYVAILDSSASFEASANRTRDNDIALQNAVNLSLQAAKTANAVSALLSQITQTTEAARTRDTESSLAVSASVVVDGTTNVLSSATLTSSASLTVDAKVRLRTRPKDFNNVSPTFNSSIKKFGTHSFPGSITGQSTLLTEDYVVETPSATDDWVMECWVYSPTPGSRNISFSIIAGYFQLSGFDFTSTTPRISARYDDEDNNTVTIADQATSTMQLNTWTHFAMVKTGSTISAYCNGLQRGTTTVSSPTYRSGRDYIRILSDGYYIDEVSFCIGDNYGFDATSSTITVPTSARSDSEFTSFLYHLDNNDLDNYVGNYTVEAGAQLNSASTLSLTAGLFISGASLQASSGTLTADAEVIKVASASLDSSASATADITRVRFAEVSLSSAFTSTVEATKTVDADSTQSVSATLAVDSIRIRDAVINTDAIATQLAVVAKVGDFFINIEPAFTQTATAIKRVDADSALSSSFNASVEAIKVVEAQFNANTTATMPSVDAQRTRSANSVLDTIATQTATASKTIETAVAVNSAFTVTVTADKFTGNQIALGSAFTQPSTQVHRIRETALDVDIVATQTVGAIKVVEAAVAINTSATLSIQPLRIRPGVILTDAIASQLSVVAKVGNGLIALDNAFSLSVSATVTTGNTIAISAEFTQTAQNDRIRFSSLDLDSAFTQTVDAVIGIDANANFNSSATLGVAAVAVKDASARIDGVLEFSSTVRANLVGEIPLYVDSALTATATVTKSADLALTAQFAQSVIGSKLVPASANLSSAFTQTANGKLLVFLEQLTFKIPKETRSYGIRSENRGFKINNENTTYKVRG